VTHRVKLEVFEGPIDLLLHLITRQRVDIYEVSLSTITEEYVTALESLEGLDLESATGFLVVAATLLELKSARLLPARQMDPEDVRLLEERDLLLARLVECATFSESGSWISRKLELGEGYHGRTASLEPQFVDLVPDLLARLSPHDLTLAAARALAIPPRPELDTSHVAPIRASVRDAIVAVAEGLSGGTATFEALCRGVTERLEIVVRFLALLELFKSGAVDISQADRFSTIEATWTGEVDTATVLAEADEYAIGQEPAQ
jgi:segregation and condensation protein A